MLMQYSFIVSILSGNWVKSHRTTKNPYFIQMTLNILALPFCQSQNSIMEISNDFCLCVCLLVCLFVCGRLNVPVNKFFSHVGTVPLLPGYYQHFLGVKCLGQGRNTAEVGFEPRFFSPDSDALPLSHRAPPVSNTNITKFQKCTLSWLHKPLDGPLRDVLPLLCAYEDTLKIGQLAVFSQSCRICPSLLHGTG